MSKEDKNIELRSRKVRLIIGKMPPLLIRISMPIILFVFILLFVLATSLPYGQNVSCKVVVKKSDSVATMFVYIPYADRDEVENTGQIRIILNNGKLNFYSKYNFDNDTIVRFQNNLWSIAKAHTDHPVSVNDSLLVKLTEQDTLSGIITGKKKTLYTRLLR